VILERLMKHLREQNWTAVAIEFVIVVVGVVIGFQVTDWKESRKERRQEHTYLVRLLSDMDRSIENLTREVDTQAEWYERGSQALFAIVNNDRSAMPDEKTGFSLLAATRLSTSSPLMATINELIGGGNLNLIRNPELRAAISEAEATIVSLQAYIDILVQYESSLVPPIFSRLRPIPHPDREGVIAIAYDFDALAGDEVFQNVLGQSLRMVRTNRLWLTRSVDVAKDLRAKIVAELESRGFETNIN